MWNNGPFVGFGQLSYLLLAGGFGRVLAACFIADLHPEVRPQEDLRTPQSMNISTLNLKPFLSTLTLTFQVPTI